MTPGSKWKRHDGKEFKLLGCCRLEATGEPHVVYKAWEDGTDFGEWWAIPLSQWCEAVSPGVHMFALIEEKP